MPLRHVVAIILSALVATGVPAPSHAAVASSADRVAVDVRQRVWITDDGAVVVIVRHRCPAPLQAFEIDVTVTQREVSGSAFESGPGLLACDGRWHWRAMTVEPTLGDFVPGRARVDVYVGLHDPATGTDSEARDSELVRVCGR